ncbi:hypothetical protein ACVWZT_003769 [Pseudomonas sp. TE21394]
MILPRLGSLTVHARPLPSQSFPALVRSYGRLLDALPAIVSQAIRLTIVALLFVHQRVVIRVGDGRSIRVNCRVGSPVISWDIPDDADIAFAELNAATIGVHAAVHFESKRLSDPTAPKIGGPVSLELEHKLKFHFILPKYDDECSASRWPLSVHRYGDGTFPDFIDGETLALDECRPIQGKALAERETFHGFSQPKWPDYKDNISVKKSDGRMT